MAGTSRPPYCLAFICLYSFSLAHCIHVACASSFAFNFTTIATSPCGNDLECHGDAVFANQMMELTKNDISRGCNVSQGRVWYASPVLLWDAITAQVASFTSTFAFKITPDKDYTNANGTYNIGDGMAFFLAPYSTDVLSSGGGGGKLGLFNDTTNNLNATGDSSVIAVEFDTYQNWDWDDSAQHVGIDVNSIRSEVSTNTSVAGDKVINLQSNVMMTARIDFDNLTKILAVNLDINGSLYHVNDTVDLELLLPEKVAVGFSATTGLFAQLHRISFWSFNSSLGEKVAPPHASASSQKIPHPSNSIQRVKPEPSTKYSTATGSPSQLQRISFSSFHPSTQEKAASPALAPSQKTPYQAIVISPVEPGSTKFSAVAGSSAGLHRISSSSLCSALEENVVSVASPPSPKILEPSTKCSTTTGLSTELHRVLVQQKALSLAPELQQIPPDLLAPAPQPNPADSPAPESQQIPADSPAPAPQPNPVDSSAPASQQNPADSPAPSYPPASASHPYPPPPDSTGPGKERSPATPSGWHPQIVAPVLAVSACGIAGLLLWLWQKQKRKRHDQSNKVGTAGSESEEQHSEADFEKGLAGPRRYHYRELAAATGDFKDDNRLGRGGFGNVYQGTLRGDGDSDKQVAVKKFSSETSSQGRREFEAEVKIISRLRHRNLVQLLGWCDSAKGLLLVYELVPEGSLDKHIYNNTRLLTWSERYQIIIGLGSALRYLHREWDQCVVHGDIKPSNIMLDSSYNTKLGDFGLARLTDHGADPRTTMNIAGTAGYVDPDFVNMRRPSTQSDIYSFGIVLLEIVSGKPPVVQDPPFMLLKWVWSLHSQGAIIDAADERLWGADVDERQMERTLMVGLWCAHHDPAQRPSIVDAMLVLQSEDAKLPVLPPYMYKLAARPSVVSTGEISGVSGTSFSSGMRSSATTGTTRYSSDSFLN